MLKKKNFLRRRWPVLAIGLLLLLFIVSSLRPKPQPIDVLPVERGALQVTIDEEGETRVRDRFVVSAPLAARVERIELEPGDPVKAGETVVALLRPVDPSLLDARSAGEAEAGARAAESFLRQAQAERERAAAELRFAELEQKRMSRLAQEQIVAQDQNQAAELRASTAREALLAAEAAVSRARHELERARAMYRPDPRAGGAPIALKAPVDGVLLRRFRESESVVQAGERLLEIGAADQLEIVSDLLSTDAVRVAPGGRVLVEQWGGAALEGKVRRVEPAGFTKFSALGVEEQRVNVIIDFASPAEAFARLGDGYRVEVRIVTYENGDALKVPNSALFRDNSDWAAYTMVDGKAALRRVKIGERNGREAEVLEGLKVGAQVILHPSDLIKDGVLVEVRK